MSSIQVKTTTKIKKGKGTWILGKKNEGFFNDNFFYIFVSLGEKTEFFVVPSKNVSDYITKNHQQWLNEPGKNHKDSNIRQISYEFVKQYKDNWHLLK